MTLLKSISAILFFLLLSPSVYTQGGTIKGLIIDQQSEMPLIGATVSLLGTQNGTSTNVDGYFTLTEVSIGRHSVEVNYLGYESLTIPNIEVTSGKEVFLNLELVEGINNLEEVVITAETLKDQAQNEMAVISARQFGLEEVSRYAGGRGDVGRLAANFAGVSSPDDSRNDIVIRGNSPTGVLWQLEGIPIPNPNHYSTFGTTGGPVSAMNPNMLKNSDFLTSAFPAEYGNALGGVFDLGFRNGNKDRMEYTLQLGAFSGIEGIIEGPLGKGNGSFLIAGRYSFVGLVGAQITSAVPDYKDLSFKFDFGKSRIGNFTLFGIGGISNITFLGDDIDEGDLFALKDENNYVEGGFGVLGLKHNLILGDNTYLRTIFGASRRQNKFASDRYFDKSTAEESLIRVLDSDNIGEVQKISSFINHKFNSKLTLKGGGLVEKISLDNIFTNRADTPDIDGDGIRDWMTIYDIDESLYLVQPFVQSKYRITEKLSANLGVHGQWSSLNEQLVLEPRTALEYKINNANTFNIGYGIHHQNAPLPIVFLQEEKDGQTIQSNRDLNFIRSQHFVIGHDLSFAQDWRLKTEVYYQKIDNAPIESTPSYYSTLVEGAGFVFATDKVNLVSQGTGVNRGVEVTVEKFYSNGFHGLLTGSFFSSTYKGSDDINRSTPYDNGFVINVLGGKEFPFGKNAFVVDTKFTTSGGRFFTPIDLEASQEEGFQVFKYDEAFSQQYQNYFRWDIKLGVKFNSSKRKISHQLFLDFQNITNRENIFISQYNRQTNSIQQLNQVGFFPDFLYRIQF